MNIINQFLNKAIKTLEKILEKNTSDDKFEEESRKYNDDVYLLFKKIKKSFKKTTNLYIFKPDVVIDSNVEVLIPRFDIYKLQKDLEELTLKEKQIMVDEVVDITYLDFNNCIYVTYTDRETNSHPITLTFWCLNPKEIRIGIFIQRSFFNDSEYESINESTKGLLRMWESKMFQTTFVSKEREVSSLNEVIINFDTWQTFEQKKQIINLSGLLTVLIFLNYMRIEVERN